MRSAGFVLASFSLAALFAAPATAVTVTDITADATYLPGATLDFAPSQIVVTLSEEIDAATVNTDTFRLVRSGGDGTLTDGNEVEVTPASVTPTAGDVMTVSLGGAAASNDSYRLTILGTDASTGLVGHWKFEEGSGDTAYDTSGSDNHGTLINMDPATDWVTGKIGGALDFDGIDDYVGFHTVEQTAFTVSAWVDMRSSGSSAYPRIFETWALVLLVLPGSDEIHVDSPHSIAGGKWTVGYSLAGTGWHHIAVAHDGSSVANDPAIYVDGLPRAVTEAATPSGSLSSNTGGGRIDEVCF